MEFKDYRIANLAESPVGLYELIVRFFCGRKLDPRLDEREKQLLGNSLDSIRKNGISFEQFNELLLLMNQDRISEDFYRFCFGEDRINLNDMKKGIERFRGFAMLCFGNFRFAFRELAQKKVNDLEKALSPFCGNSDVLENSFLHRPRKMLDIHSISREMTYFTGELSGNQLNRQTDFLEKDLKAAAKKKDPASFLELLEIKDEFDRIKTLIEKTQHQAIENADVYLTWDFMDVYIATSMRNQWEFEETYDFIREVFGDKNLQKLNLRYFDPTQSKCRNQRDKGLIEGLMLKRSLCAIYMAQEGDTMGKDSELAATLAQSKPVIAYVPRYDIDEYSKRIAKYSLDFFKMRLQILDAEGTLSERKCERALTKYRTDFQDLIGKFLEELDRFREKHPYYLPSIEIEFKRRFADFPKICDIVSIAQNHNFDQRANLLGGLHPLCMQVDLRTGVANGVLVVRNPGDCARILYSLLTNRMKFGVSYDKGFTVLEENISKCAFRVVTENEKLTNSFWNLFSKA